MALMAAAQHTSTITDRFPSQNKIDYCIVFFKPRSLI